MTQHWTAKTVDRRLSGTLQEACGITELVADTLVARGISSVREAEEFLHPDIDREWTDPELIFGLKTVTDALEKAILEKKRILVFGDFDVDGISATALMIRGLAALNVSADFLIPRRIDEGYGLTSAVLERIYEKDPEVVLTVDCGISAQSEIKELQSHGIEVLVTDHHEPSDNIPISIPVANPKLENNAPSSILAGAGVALKLIALLGLRFNRPKLWCELLDLAALGTLGDIMPLKAENRALVAAGISMIEHSPRPGLAAALSVSGIEANELRATTLSFTLIPRLNAAGRMGDPVLALSLLLSENLPEADSLALELEEANAERKLTEAAIFDEALSETKRLYHGQKIMIVVGQDWHEGVKGIVASRLVTHLGMPVIVFTEIKGELRGSGRSIGSINLFKAVEQCASKTTRFGGHEAAVGVTIPKENLDDFRCCMESILAKEPLESFLAPLQVDAELDLSIIDTDSASQLRLFEPFGQENEEPLYVSRAVFLQNTRAVGANKNHLSCTVTDGRASLQAIYFKCPDIEGLLAYSGAVDVLYRLRLDEWNGRIRTKLYIEKVLKRAEGLPIPKQSSAQQSDILPLNTQQSDAQQSDAEQSDAEQSDAQTDNWPDISPCSQSGQRIKELSDVSLQRLASEILGTEASLHDSQKTALKALSQGASVLVVMATGRGKSLIFQTHAALLALRHQRASVFIYPLRALIADQNRSISEGFRRLGLNSCPLTGENSTEEKDRVFQDLYEGETDVILTTPEFFQLHAWRFAQSQRISFIVFDEAHHLETELQVGREAYFQLKSTRKMFPEAQFLAVTATSDDRITEGICQALSIDQLVIDNSKRENLLLDDARNLRDRELYLASIVEKATKTVIYVNSRAQAITLARFLRKRSPSQAHSIAFYHAGLSRQERQEIEEGLRSGGLSTILSTNAFGEGVNVPDISHLVLFHLPFSEVAFNQLSGRAGRNGEKAWIHLLFNEEDARINRQILAPLAPDRECLVLLFLALRHLDGACGQSHHFRASLKELVEICNRIAHRAPDKEKGRLASLVQTRARAPFVEKGIANCLAVFEELGLIATELADDGTAKGSSDEIFHITLFNDKGRVELSSSSRYLEGRDELVLFERFRHWAFTASADELRAQMIGPLLPVANEGIGSHE